MSLIAAPISGNKCFARMSEKSTEFFLRMSTATIPRVWTIYGLSILHKEIYHFMHTNEFLNRCTKDLPMCLQQKIKDRKSTRLNSSHVKTSYAVFCSKRTTTPQK